MRAKESGDAGDTSRMPGLFVVSGERPHWVDGHEMRLAFICPGPTEAELADRSPGSGTEIDWHCDD